MRFVPVIISVLTATAVASPVHIRRQNGGGFGSFFGSNRNAGGVSNNNGAQPASGEGAPCNNNKGICERGVCSDIGGGGNFEDPVCEVGASTGDDAEDDFGNFDGKNNNNNNGVVQPTSGEGAPCNNNKGICDNGVCSDIGGGGNFEDPICEA